MAVGPYILYSCRPIYYIAVGPYILDCEFLHSKTHSFQWLEVLTETFVFSPMVPSPCFCSLLIQGLHWVLTVGPARSNWLWELLLSGDVPSDASCWFFHTVSTLMVGEALGLQGVNCRFTTSGSRLILDIFTARIHICHVHAVTIGTSYTRATC